MASLRSTEPRGCWLGEGCPAAVEVLDPDLSRRLGCCVPPEIDSRIDFITSENVDLVSLGLSVI